MNPAIVAPDAFDIVDVTLDKGLTADQRRNLGFIAKVLQYAASNKMFERESAHLFALNSYIPKAFEKFKLFFKQSSTVEDAEIHFNIDQYSDVTMVTKPVVYMTVQEIIDTHQVRKCVTHSKFDCFEPLVTCRTLSSVFSPLINTPRSDLSLTMI